MKSSFLKLIFITICVFYCFAASAKTDAASEKSSVLYASLTGGISPAQVHLLEEIIDRADDENHRMILLRLDTPGGLGSSMRDMIKIMMNCDLPICVWVGPSGAQAASAGTFLVAAADVSGMAPGTTIGAASPVSPSGEDLPETMSGKIKNDMTSLIRGIASRRGRNVQWYEKSVEEGASLDAQGAAVANVVDFIAVSTADYLDQLGARGVKTQTGIFTFSSDTIELVTYTPGLSYSVLSWLLDPQIAYFLLLGGMLGIFFELSHPGTLVPGVIGGFCFLTGLYAMSILPTNAAGLLLIIFGAVLFVLEIFIVSYGLLSIAAAASLFVGSLVLFRRGEGLDIPLPTILGTVISFSAFAGLLIYIVTRSQLRKSGIGLQSMIGLEGVVIKSEDRRFKIRVRGEIWNAVASPDDNLKTGTEVEVVKTDGLTLTVVKKK